MRIRYVTKLLFALAACQGIQGAAQPVPVADDSSGAKIIADKVVANGSHSRELGIEQIIPLPKDLRLIILTYCKRDGLAARKAIEDGKTLEAEGIDLVASTLEHLFVLPIRHIRKIPDKDIHKVRYNYPYPIQNSSGFLRAVINRQKSELQVVDAIYREPILKLVTKRFGSQKLLAAALNDGCLFVVIAEGKDLFVRRFTFAAKKWSNLFSVRNGYSEARDDFLLAISEDVESQVVSPKYVALYVPGKQAGKGRIYRWYSLSAGTDEATSQLRSFEISYEPVPGCIDRDSWLAVLPSGGEIFLCKDEYSLLASSKNGETEKVDPVGPYSLKLEKLIKSVSRAYEFSREGHVASSMNAKQWELQKLPDAMLSSSSKASILKFLDYCENTLAKLNNCSIRCEEIDGTRGKPGEEQRITIDKWPKWIERNSFILTWMFERIRALQRNGQVVCWNDLLPDEKALLSNVPPEVKYCILQRLNVAYDPSSCTRSERITLETQKPTSKLVKNLRTVLPILIGGGIGLYASHRMRSRKKALLSSKVFA